MPKKIGKFYIAIVPTDPLQGRATELKLQLKDKFNLKYALKSPAHVTLKMPFLWNEAKEYDLISHLSQFFMQQPGFGLTLNGIGKFGKRVLYVKVGGQTAALYSLQKKLVTMCQTTLNLKQEMSDYAYHPHMTLAHKDVKHKLFEDYFLYLKSTGFQENLKVQDIALLRKEIGRWEVYQRFPLNAMVSQ
jgi:2'-5' RNA ligase